MSEQANKLTADDHEDIARDLLYRAEHVTIGRNPNVPLMVARATAHATIAVSMRFAARPSTPGSGQA